MKNIGLKIFGILTSIGMVIVLIQGALVTQTDSGDACGSEWPLCLGQVFPDSPTVQTIIEYTHRVFSALVGLMVVILAIWAWRKLTHMAEAKFFAIMSVLFVILQGLLGAAAVVFGQSDAVMALHMGFSLISLATVFILTILAFENDFPLKKITVNISKKFKYYIYFLFAFLYFVVYTGAYVKHTESSAACAGWPLCSGKIIPPLEGKIAIQFGHRVAAFFLFLFILSLFIHAVKKYKHEPLIFYTSLISFILITIQVLSGAVVIFTGFTLAATMFHAVFISLLFVVLSYMVVFTHRSSRAQLNRDKKIA